VSAAIVGTGGVEVVVADPAHVDHGRDVQLTHRLVQGKPQLVVEWAPGPPTAGGIGVQVAADEAHVDAAPEFSDGIGHAGRRIDRALGQGTHRGEVGREQLADPPDEIVGVLGPEPRRRGVADVVAHAAGPRGEQSQVDAPFPLQPELIVLDAVADLIVGDGDLALVANMTSVDEQRLLLGLPVGHQLGWGRGVVAVTVDDHRDRT